MDNLVTALNTELEDRGWSIRRLARESGISHSWISQVANGNTPPSLDFCAAIAKGFKQPLEKWLRIAGHLMPLSPQVADEQEIINAWRQLQPDERAVIKRAICGLVESAPAKATQRGDLPQPQRERMEAPDEPLGDRAYDLDEIAVIMLDAVTTVLTPETLKLGAQLLLLRAQARERGDPAQSLNDQLAAAGGRLQPKTERVPSGTHDPLALD